MPQKRNAFVLENIKARCGHVIGSHIASLIAEKSAPFTNTIEVGTEAMSSFDPCIEAFQSINAMLRRHIQSACVNPERSAQIMLEGNVDATFEAERAVLCKHIAFRTAYNIVRNNIMSTSKPRNHADFGSDAIAEHGRGPSPMNTVRICDWIQEMEKKNTRLVSVINAHINEGNKRMHEALEDLLH